MKMGGTVPTRLYNTALMVAPHAVEAMLSGDGRQNPLPPLSEPSKAGLGVGKLRAFFGDEIDFDDNDDSFGDNGYVQVNGTAFIEVNDGLIYRGYGWGCTKYSDVRRAFRAAMSDVQVQRVVFLIDSPGGEVAGLFDLVDEIYNARGTKPIIALSDEQALSAAYAIASAADEVYLPPTGVVGSVGVIAIHVDQSAFDKQVGLSYTVVCAGDHKDDFVPFFPLKPEAVSILQEHVNSIYGKFTSVVARNRGLSQDAVIQTQAGVYLGDAAVASGLADGVLSIQGMIDKFCGDGGDDMNLDDVRNVVNQAFSEGMVDLKQKIEAIESRLAAASSVPQVASGTELAGEIVALCDAAGVPELSGALIRDGVTLDGAKASILEHKANAADRQTIISTIGVSSGVENPLMADAKKRADSVRVN